MQTTSPPRPNGTRRGRPARRRRRWAVAGAVVVLVAVALVVRIESARPPIVPGCAVAGLPPQQVSYGLNLDQAANAATIAAVGKSVGLPDHAVTVALAAALQESKLTNLPSGDLDSVGLFQQRPSEGWGSVAQLTDPRYAARAFYERLAKVPGWETMAVTDAAQSVQHSAAPSAYADWEDEARAMAAALTGEVPAGLACVFPSPSGRADPAALARAAAVDLGPGALGRPLPAARGWAVATWAVAHAYSANVTTVTFDRRRWTATSGQWRDDASAGPSVVVGGG